jgi:spore photoproduct lyase
LAPPRKASIRKEDTFMKHGFDTIWVRRELENVPEVEAFLEHPHTVSVTFFESLAEVRVPGATMAAKIASGKRVLVIDKRSGPLLDRFENHDPGAVCPDFPKLIPSTNCPYECQYCFLSGTYRACRPFICAYVVAVQKLERDVWRQYGKADGVTIISAGEMSDPLACDVLGYMPRIVEMFGRIDNVKLLLLTKSGIDEIQPLLDVNHNGHTITSWSITCEEVVARYEQGNESIANRLAAAKAAQDAGYEVRFRLDPMMVFEGWQDAFARTIDRIYQLGIRPSRFTLGSFRLLGNLRSIIKARFPESDILQQPLVNEAGKRWRYPHETREELYLHAITCIREHDADCPVALCKETPDMHRTFNGMVDATKCNCLP